jgi:acetyltransferase
MHNEQHYLHTLFEPGSIAIVGASETPNSIGVTLVRNMLDSGYKGKLFFVNPKHETVFGQQSYPSVDTIPQRLDIAVICTKAATVPEIIDACGRAGCKNAIVISGGFAEAGPRGACAGTRRAGKCPAPRHAAARPQLPRHHAPGSQLNLTFAHGSANAGTIGLISQSGALCTAILDWALPNKVGFSNVVSLGSESDIDFGEVLDYMVSDPRTENIFLYIEGIKNARRFMSALRAAARCKPVLLIKVGKHPAGEKAALSHTGALVGADDVFDAALRRAGVVRLANVGQMYAAASALFSHFRPRGKRLAIITNGGGPGVMAADHAADIGIPLAQLDPGDHHPPQRNPSPKLVEGQSDRHPRRRRSGALWRRAPGLHRRRPRRWRAGHPHAAGDDRPDPGRAHRDRNRTPQRQAAGDLLDGRGAGERSAQAVQGRRHSRPSARRNRRSTCSRTSPTTTATGSC